MPWPLTHNSAETVSVVLKPQDCKLSLSASKFLFQRFSFGNADGAWEPAFHRQMVMLEALGHTLRSTSSGGQVLTGCLACHEQVSALQPAVCWELQGPRDHCPQGSFSCKMICIINLMQDSAKGKITGMRRD